MSFASDRPVEIIEGRECGKCSLCCKLVGVDELAKPPGKWCKDCAPGKEGCKIYETRPKSCRDFLCLWRVRFFEELGPEWYPTTAKLVVSMEASGKRIAVSVDPSLPGRWREKPYYSMIKRWAYLGALVNAQVIVNTGRNVTVVLPNKEVDLGPVEPDHHVVVSKLNVPPGSPPDWYVSVARAADLPADQGDT